MTSDIKTRAQILGENLERVRKEKGITRKQLAESIGVSEVAVSQYATGANSPKLEKIFEIADVLKVSVASIIGENNFADNIPNVEKIVADKIFEYRLQRAFNMVEKHLSPFSVEYRVNQEPRYKHFDKDGHIVICIPEEIYFDREKNTYSFKGGYYPVAFKNEKDFVEVMERAENDALSQRIPFYKAVKKIISHDED